MTATLPPDGAPAGDDIPFGVDDLASWDGSVVLARFVAEYGGLVLLRWVEQELGPLRYFIEEPAGESWPNGKEKKQLVPHEATLGLRLAEDEDLFRFEVTRGWPRHAAPTSLALVQVYYAAVCGLLPKLPREGRPWPHLARYKLRMLVEAGLAGLPASRLAPLDERAPEGARTFWRVADHLDRVRRVADADEDDRVPLSAPFLAEEWALTRGEPWPGVSVAALVSGRRWCRKKGLIVPAGALEVGKPKPLQLWRFAETTHPPGSERT